jgi:hypothetical protein
MSENKTWATRRKNMEKMNSTWELQNLSKKYEINEGSLAISQ